MKTQVVAMLAAAALAGCAKGPEPECDEIANTIVNPTLFWVQEIVHEQKSKVDPQHCSMIVNALSASYPEDPDVYTQNQFQIEADFKRFSNGGYTYTYHVETLGVQQVQATPPTMEQALASGREFEKDFGEDDMCFGFNEQVVKGQEMGSGQSECRMTQAVFLYNQAGGIAKFY